MLKWIVLAPLIGAIVNGFFGKRLPEKVIGLIACSSVAVSTGLAFFAFFTFLAAFLPCLRFSAAACPDFLSPDWATTGVSPAGAVADACARAGSVAQHAHRIAATEIVLPMCIPTRS